MATYVLLKDFNRMQLKLYKKNDDDDDDDDEDEDEEDNE